MGLAEISERDRDDERSTGPIPEAVVATLREAFARYQRGNPFRPGNLVTPCAASDVRGKGKPHIVLETRQCEGPDFSPCDPSETTLNAYGARRDIRVASMHGSSVPSHWVESWQFEFYTGPGADA